MLKPLAFEQAVRLFELWGFKVEPGPGSDEVSLVLEGEDYRTYAVYEAEMLPQIAEAALKVRWQNGFVAIEEGQWDNGSLEVMPFPVGAASLLRA
jgi:hypothetical protein